MTETAETGKICLQA